MRRPILAAFGVLLILVGCAEKKEQAQSPDDVTSLACSSAKTCTESTEFCLRVQSEDGENFDRAHCQPKADLEGCVDPCSCMKYWAKQKWPDRCRSGLNNLMVCDSGSQVTCGAESRVNAFFEN